MIKYKIELSATLVPVKEGLHFAEKDLSRAHVIEALQKKLKDAVEAMFPDDGKFFFVERFVDAKRKDGTSNRMPE